MSASQKITGINSGFDTATIVEQLMAIEKIPYQKLDVKKQTEELKLQAYQSINSMLMKFRTSVGSLASAKLWQSKTAASTLSDSISVVANQYAVNGAYSLRVAQLATSAQFRTKGFASSKTSFVKQNETDLAYKMGTLSLNSAKVRVDNSAKLEHLNGGKGVYRGSVRVTDAANNSSVIDLSACDTMEDVVRALNSSPNAQILAGIEDGRLKITDASGGAGSVKVQNVGGGSTASDLGIEGAGTLDGGLTLLGRNVNVMGGDTALSLLQDGLGIEEGTFYLRVSKGAEYYDVGVNVDDCSTVGDLVKRVNDEIEYRVSNRLNDPASGGGYALLQGLAFGLNDAKTAFALTGTQGGATYQFYENPDPNLVVAQKPASQLGLVGRQMSVADGQVLEFARVMGGVNSPMLKNLSGAAAYGIGSAGNSALIPVVFSSATKISALNAGAGVDGSMPLQIRLHEGGSDVSNSESLIRTFYDVLDPARLNAMLSDPDATIGELVSLINESLAAYAADPTRQAAGLSGMKALIDENNQRLVIQGGQAGYKIEMVGTLANSLGLFRRDDQGTAMETGDAMLQADLANFYGGVTDLMGANLSIEAGSAMRDLENFYAANLPVGVTPAAATDAEIAAAIQATLGQGLRLNLGGQYLMGFSGGYPQYFDFGNDHVAVDIDFSGLAVNANDNVGDFLNQVNAAIASQVESALTAEARTLAGDPSITLQVSPPQLRVDTYAKGFQWSNMNFSNSFKAEGALAAQLGLDKSFNFYVDDILNPGNYVLEAGSLAVGALPTDTLGGFSFNPMTSAYLREMDLDGTTQLGYLNNGVGLSFAGADSDAIDFDLGTGGSFSITMGELRNTLNSSYSSLNTSLADYATMLNGLVAGKLSGIGSAATLEFRLGEKGLEIFNLSGADKLKVSGPGADAAKTGVSAVDIASDPTGQVVKLSELKAADVVIGSADGLGEIKLKWGGAEYTLSTSGMNGDSTLSDLVSRLNRELASQGVAGVSFSVNDAGTGIAVDNNSGQKLEFVNTRDINTVSRDLGLIDHDGKGVSVDSHTRFNAASLGRKYLSRATSLSSLMGNGVLPGTIVVTGADGRSRTIDMSEAKTVGDVLDAINVESGFGVQAIINERGDGITLIEAYPLWAVPSVPPQGNITVADFDGGSLAKKLGIAGQGDRDNALGVSIFEGSLRTVIDVMSSDTLESLMYRISEEGYKTSIVNDGSGAAPYRLTISSSNTGEVSDFVIETDLDFLGCTQVSRAKDAKVLYGEAGSTASPMLLSSATNSNSTAILGLTLDLKAVSDRYSTITVGTDKEKVVEELKNMVQTYNDLNDLVSYLDAYDAETGQPGVLFGDTNIRKLMEDINEMFYLIFNPDQQRLGTVNEDGKHNAWTWMDLGVSLTAKNSNTDGSGTWYSSMDLNLDTLDDMVANNWEILAEALAGQRNASNSKLSDSVKPSAVFNGGAADGFKAENAINGDYNKGSWGVNNGFMAEGTIAQGQNEYAIYFQQPTTVSRMSVYHYDSDTALKNYTIEYLDAATGKWETFREVKSNTQDGNHFGTAVPITASAIRIKAESTNAGDGKFRLLDVQVFEDIGLAGKLNQLTTALGDSQFGFLAERDAEIKEKLADLGEQMTRLQSKLDLKEQNLWGRFNSMESALGQLQSQSNYFTSMMDSLSTSKKK